MRPLFFLFLILAGCGGSGGGSTPPPTPPAINHLTFVASGAPTDIYYPSSATYEIDVTITNDGNVNTAEYLSATVTGGTLVNAAFGVPAIPTLNVGDVYVAHVSLASLVGQTAGTYTLIISGTQHTWTQTFVIDVHFGSAG